MSFFDNDEEEVSPFDLLKRRKDEQAAAATPTPATVPEGDFLKQFMSASKDRSGIDKARGDADRSNKITGVIQGLATAFGGGNRNAGFYDGLRAQNNAKAKTAESDHATKLDNLLMQDKLGQQVTDRARASEKHGWDATKHSQDTQDFTSNKTADSPAAKSMSLFLQTKGMKSEHLKDLSYEQMKDVYKQAANGSSDGDKWSIQTGEGPNGEPQLFRVGLNSRRVEPIVFEGSQLNKKFADKLYKDAATGETKLVSANVANPIQATLNAPKALDPNKPQPSSNDIRNSLNPVQRTSVDEVQKSYDSQTKTLMSRKEAANSVKELVGAARNGNQMSKEGFGSMMARLNSEVGALSEADKAPFGGAAGWAATLNRVGELQFWDGKMTEQDLKFLETTVGALENGVDNSLQRYQQRASQMIQDRTGLSPEYSGQLLNPVSTQPTTKPADKPVGDPAVENKIKKVMNNPKNAGKNMTRESVIKQLIRAEMLPEGTK